MSCQFKMALIFFPTEWQWWFDVCLQKTEDVSVASWWLTQFLWDFGTSVSCWKKDLTKTTQKDFKKLVGVHNWWKTYMLDFGRSFRSLSCISFRFNLKQVILQVWIFLYNSDRALSSCMPTSCNISGKMAPVGFYILDQAILQINA